ncbi:hypothetical protein K435DRAFT_696607 [Dendrothele bispora CBS 962.96]|uniref:DUF4100 domain-containing protein n=1 Tax=Dendrothele bispora (strain CBS 962.96) TaxID=1314807 RepID=A0A4S8KVW6_DENBC|nr:hypothetical protein K435DRAFT_696607 [Dendrothele bispora CBS 962.96]
MSVPQTVSIIQPMPVPGTPNAPVFNRKSVKQFLDTIVRHGAAAGITNKDELVDYIYYYASEDVQDAIKYIPEFDIEEADKKWDKAKNKLLKMFKASEAPPDVTLQNLKDFCQESAARSRFDDKMDIESYQMQFLKLATPLIKTKIITTIEANYYFVAGIPSSWKAWFRNEVPEANRNADKAPEIEDSMEILFRKFNPNDLCYEWWKVKNKTKKQVKFEDATNRVASRSSTPKPKTTEVEEEVTYPNGINYGVPQSAIDGLAEQMRLLNLNMSNLHQGQGPTPQVSLQIQPGMAGKPSDAQRLLTFNRACMMCGEVGTHPLHPSKCDKTPGLLLDKLISFNPETNRYTQRNGADLPRVPFGWKGGIDSFLRNTQPESTDVKGKGKAVNYTTGGRDTPPHMVASTSSGFMGCSHNLGLSYGEEFVLDGNVFAVATAGHEYETAPALRTGKNTDRYNPLGDKSKRKETTSPSPNTTKAPLNEPSAGKPTIIPPPTNPINRSDGWKGSLPSENKNKRDVSMKDATKPTESQSTPQYHFTSDMQEQVDPRAVFKTAMGVMVTLPLHQVIGVSPILQKMIAESTRTRREYVKKDADNNRGNASKSTNEAKWEGVDEMIDSPEVYEARKAETHIVDFDEKYYAMTCGYVDIVVNGTKLKALIDSGSELNLFSVGVPEDAKLPLDFEGTEWSLKGIHGPSVPLRGVIKDAPLTIGGHEFPHHFFVSRHDMGKQDIIIGQPFLQWYATRTQHSRESGLKMWLYKEGYSGMRPTVCVQLTDPRDPRNTKVIGRAPCSGHGSRPDGCSHSTVRDNSWRIEEVDDEEDF